MRHYSIPHLQGHAPTTKPQPPVFLVLLLLTVVLAVALSLAAPWR